MVFKRRTKRTLWQNLREGIYPSGGFVRAFQYIKHRLRRLPDPPHKIARGIWAGVFISFTPLFGFHLIGALLIAWALRGNLIAAAIGTFFGNAFTYAPLGLLALEVGTWMLGLDTELSAGALLDSFVAAGNDLWSNFKAIFTPATASWDGLVPFYHDIFVPYLLGSIGPGVIGATICYYLTIPLVEAYQNRHRAKLKKRLAEQRALSAEEGVGGRDSVPGAGE